MLTKKQWKYLKTAYLHADGHLICHFERFHSLLGRIGWYEQWEKTKVELSFPKGEGRLILSPGLLALALQSTHLQPEMPSVELGSTKSKALNVSVGYLTMLLKGSMREISLESCPGILVSDWTYQSDINEKFDSSLREYGYNNERMTTHKD